MSTPASSDPAGNIPLGTVSQTYAPEVTEWLATFPDPRVGGVSAELGLPHTAPLIPTLPGGPVTRLACRLEADVNLDAEMADQIATEIDQLPLPTRSVATLAIEARLLTRPESAQELLAEAARVVAPNGVLLLVWNHLGNQVPWVQQFRQLCGTDLTPADLGAVLSDLQHFDQLQHRSHRHWFPVTATGMAQVAQQLRRFSGRNRHNTPELIRASSRLYEQYTYSPKELQLPFTTHGYRLVRTSVAAPQRPGHSGAPTLSGHDGTNSVGSTTADPTTDASRRE